MTSHPAQIQFGYTFHTVRANLDGITHEESLRSPHPGGNCLNWVLGHLVASRDELLAALGDDGLWNKEQSATYRRGSAPLGDDRTAASFESLATLFQQQQDRLETALASLTPERLAEPAPISPAKKPDETVGSLIAAFAFHEAYHAGQLGLLRRLAGKPGVLT